jgi:hypothetical protein
VSKTTVVNCRFEEYDVYIGRPSPFGNPFSHKDGTLAKYKVDTREDAVAKFREWIQTQPQLLARLHELKGKRLGCWCKNPRAKKPIVCHGDVLAELADQLPD